jgi:hypothetical protein
MLKSALNSAELINDPLRGALIIKKSQSKEKFKEFRDLIEKEDFNNINDLAGYFKKKGLDSKLSLFKRYSIPKEKYQEWGISFNGISDAP